jgi:hypothetical protein
LDDRFIISYSNSDSDIDCNRDNDRLDDRQIISDRLIISGSDSDNGKDCNMDSDRLDDRLIMNHMLIISDRFIISTSSSERLSLHLYFMWKEGERKGGCSLLPIGAGEYMELYIPLGLSL